MSKHPECDKLNARTDEWNVIYPFMEWLQEQGIILARHDTVENAKARGEKPDKDRDIWVRPYPYAIGKHIDEMLYEYFDVDPAKLEQERRKILDVIREKNLK